MMQIKVQRWVLSGVRILVQNGFLVNAANGSSKNKESFVVAIQLERMIGDWHFAYIVIILFQ